MISFRQNETDINTELHLEGDATIKNAGEIFAQIKTIYDRNKNLVIVTEKIESADISFLQILICAVKSFEAKNRSCKINKRLSIAVKKLLFNSGYDNLKSAIISGSHNE